MPTYYDSKGTAHNLSEKIGSGGEGTIFVCPSDRTMVAKIYHEPITDEKAEKLRWMAENKDEQLLKVAAWVVEVLLDAPNGKVVGFLMPNVRAKEIHELYSLKSRRIHFPDATWNFLVHAAANLARAFYNLHKNDHIMGDINHGNCVVLADGTVKLIDCDSFSINDGTRRHPCEVGVATHLAPELQGMNLRGVKREKKHDNFGLAVIIFQLLFLGRHPFAGNFIGNEDKSLEDCIHERRFAYGEDAHTRWVKQPPGTLSLSAMPPRIALMLERAFLTEDRPEPREWIEALEDLKQNLKQCAIHPGHHFYQNLASCPWCELENKTGLMLFPFTSGNQTLDGEEETFNIFTIENLLSQINQPRNLPAVLPKPLFQNVTVLPEEKINLEKWEKFRHLIIFAVIQFFLILFLTIVFGSGTAFFFGLILMVGAIFHFVNNYKAIRDGLESEVEYRRTDWNKLGNEWEKLGAANYLEKDVETIRHKVADYQNLQQDSRQKIKLLQDEALRYQLETHLSNYSIADAKISGIKPLGITELRMNGIKTAADIDSKRLQTIPNIDGYLQIKLLNWRKDLERHFEYQPNVQLPESSHQRIVREFNEKRRQIEKDIEKMLTAVRMSAGSIQQKQQQILAQTEKVGRELLQAEVNLKAIGSNAPAVFGLLLVTGFSLVIGNSFASGPTKVTRPNTYDIGSYSSSGYAPPPPPRVKPTVEPEISDDITDNEILYMADSEKISTADALYKQSQKLANTDKDFKAAEKKLRLAVKLVPTKVEIINQLGYVLYEQEKYNEALKNFRKAAQIEPDNYGTETYIGMTYLRMERFADARNTFAKITKDSPQLFVGHFNLGLAYEGLKNYESAIASLERAKEISPEDADTHLELGRCYKLSGRLSAAQDEYRILLGIDEKLAEELRGIIYTKD